MDGKPVTVIQGRWKSDRRDFASLITTFIITLTIGIQAGVLAGVILSIGFIIFQNSRPHIAILGRMPDTAKYRNISRIPQAIQWEDIEPTTLWVFKHQRVQ